MQRIADQGHDVAGLTRAMTRTPLNDLPAQDLRYRLVAHLDLGVDLQRPRSTPLQPRARHLRDRAGKLPLPLWQGRGRPLVDQTLPGSVSNCRRHHEDDQDKEEGSPKTPTLIVMLAASLGSASVRRATPVYLGRPACGENSPAAIG